METSPDMYQAMSWDCLHAFHGGFFVHHLWTEFKEVSKTLGHNSSVVIDQQYVLIYYH